MQFLIVPIDEEKLHTANFLAKQRLLYEFPREGYGKYQHITHLENLRNGYLGELSFLEVVTKKIKSKHINDISTLKKKYDKKIAINLYKKIRNEQFSWEAIIGRYDNGYDFRKDNYFIDIKTYGTDYLVYKNQEYIALRSNKKINELNLFIDKRQGKKWKNKKNIIFIQAFIEKENNKLKNVIFAGYHIGLPKSINKNTTNEAYATLVKDLKPMNDLFKLLNL